MIILGIGGSLAKAACAIIRDGKLIAAVEERKLSRQRQHSGLPEHAIGFCLHQAKAHFSDVTYIALVRPLAQSVDARIHLEIRQRFPNAQLIVADHQLAHAAAAYFVSPFQKATVLTLDRAGDFRCGAKFTANHTDLHLDNELYFPDSIGHVYGRVTDLLGFHSGADEHKVQWLSAYGDDRFVPLFRTMFGSGPWPRTERSYFDSNRLSHGAFSSAFYQALGLADGEPIPADLRPHVAAGVQRALEHTVVEMAGTGDNLCLGGGVALNAMLVSALEHSGNWRHVYVQPAAGNAGTAIGAAAHVWHSTAKQTARIAMDHLFLGPSFEAEDFKQVLENCKLRFRYLQTTDELVEAAVDEINAHKIVAWMQGAMEFGPRALGNRSLLASPLAPYSTENLNAFIKHRESFRKFAASVPAEIAHEYFEVGPNARFLATVGRVKQPHRQTFASAILGTDTIRVHTVEEKTNPLFWRLLHAAGKSTGLPVLYNTSFNLFDDPLVCTPRDAVRSYYSSGIDSMFAGHFLLQK